jgi:hypothetical protein
VLRAWSCRGAGTPRVIRSVEIKFDRSDAEHFAAATCLIGFDFDAYGKLNVDSTEDQFRVLAQEKLQELAPRVSKALKSAGVASQIIEFFFFPVPSVKDLRDQFQAKIGWNK